MCPLPLTHSSQRIRVGFCWTRVPFPSMVTTLNPTRSVSNCVLKLTVPEPLPAVLVKLMHSATTFWVQSVTFGKVGHGSHTSPTPSWSRSAWSEVGLFGQLSQTSP